MAFLSEASDRRLEFKHSLGAGHDPGRQLITDGGPSSPQRAADARVRASELPVREGEFEGKFRQVRSADPLVSDDRVRMWSAEQDGLITVRDVRKGFKVLRTIEKKDRCVVTSMCFQKLPGSLTVNRAPQEHMYVGFSDGFVRVYRKRQPQTIHLGAAEKGATGLVFRPGSNEVAAVKPRTPAELVGIQPGMCVLAIDGEPVSSGREALERIHATQGDCDISVSAGPAGQEEPEWECVGNVKKHIQEVTCMIAVEEVFEMGEPPIPVVITGGRDWQIFLWRWEVTRKPLRRKRGTAEWAQSHELWDKDQFAQAEVELEGSEWEYGPWEQGAPGSERFKAFDQFCGSQNAVRCMHFMQKPGQRVLYSGGDDYAIRCLDLKSGRERVSVPDPARSPADRGFPITGKLGHEGSIAALAANDRYLFSAGKDGKVLVWDADHGYAIGLGGTACNVLHQSSAAQLSLCIVNKQLWSAGADGIIRVWREDAEPHGTGVVRVPEGTDCVPQLSSAKPGPGNECNPELYPPLAAGALVSVAAAPKGAAYVRLENGAFLPREHVTVQPAFDDDNCFKKWRVAQMNDHLGGTVTSLEIAQRGITGTLCWSAHEDVIALHYTESALGENPGVHQEGFTAAEQRRADEVDVLRTEVLCNCADLDARRALHKRWESKVNTRTDRIGSNLARHAERETKKHYWAKMLRWLDAQRSMQRRKILAGLMVRVFGKGLEIVYFEKLREYARERVQKRRNNCVMKNLMRASDSGLCVLYWQHLQEYAHRKWLKDRHKDFGAAIMRSTDAGLRSVFFAKWTRWMFFLRAKQKKRALAEVLMGKSDVGLAQMYYNRLIDFFRREARGKSKQVIADVFSGLCGGPTLRAAYFHKWGAWARKQKTKGKVKGIVRAFAANSESLLTRLYNQKCFQWLAGRKQRATRRGIEQLSDQIGRLEDLLAKCSLTDEDIERERRRLEDLIKQLREECDAIPGQMRDIRSQCGELEKEVMLVYEPEGDTKEEQARLLLLRMKADGCNCKDDYELLRRDRQERSTEWNQLFKGRARMSEEALKHELSPPRLVERAVRDILYCVQHSWDASKAEHDARQARMPGERPELGKVWNFPVDVITLMPDKLFMKCCKAVADLIVGFDQATSHERLCKDFEETKEVEGTVMRRCVEKGLEEIVRNGSWMLAIVHRRVKEKNQDEQRAWELEQADRRRRHELGDSVQYTKQELQAMREEKRQQQEQETQAKVQAVKAGSPKSLEGSMSGSMMRAINRSLAEAGGSGSMRQPPAASSGSMRQPPAASSGSMRQPPAAGSGSMRQPPAAGSSSARQPPAAGSGSSRPTPGSSSARRVASAPKPAAKPGSSQNRPVPTKQA